MVNLKSVKVNLPTATRANIDTKNDFASISVISTRCTDKQPLGLNELVLRLNAWHRTNENLRVFISGDQDVRYGAVIHVSLHLVRSTGIQKVAFEIREPTPAQP